MSVAGSRTYGELPSELTQSLDLDWEPAGGSDPARGRFAVSGGPLSAPSLFLVSEAPDSGLFLNATALVDLFDPTFVAAPITLDPTGAWSSSETTLRQPALDGINLFCQVLAVDATSPIGFVTSAGLDVRLTD